MKPPDPYVIAIRRTHNSAIATVYRPDRSPIRRRRRLRSTGKQFVAKRGFATNLDQTALTAVGMALEHLPADADYEVIEE